MFRLSHFAAPAALAAAMFLGAQGCTHDRGDEIPASAAELSSGKESVSATAPHDGMVYVWDQNANRMLYTGKVEKGDTIKVDAKQNRIWFDDKLVTKRDDLINDHHYKIFFDSRSALRSTTIEEQRTTVTTPAEQSGTTIEKKRSAAYP